MIYSCIALFSPFLFSAILFCRCEQRLCLTSGLDFDFRTEILVTNSLAVLRRQMRHEENEEPEHSEALQTAYSFVSHSHTEKRKDGKGGWPRVSEDRRV